MTSIYSSLFLWWEASIVWCTLFIVIVSLYLYANAKHKRHEKHINPATTVANFTFVWTIIALLGLYILTATQTSQTIFVLGNIIVEAFLLLYTVKLWRRGQQQPTQPGSETAQSTSRETANSSVM